MSLETLASFTMQSMSQKPCFFVKLMETERRLSTGWVRLCVRKQRRDCALDSSLKILRDTNQPSNLPKPFSRAARSNCHPRVRSQRHWGEQLLEERTLSARLALPTPDKLKPADTMHYTVAALLPSGSSRQLSRTKPLQNSLHLPPSVAH